MNNQDIPESLINSGISIDVKFNNCGPLFGDLFQICGMDHPNFPPSGKFNFGAISHLQFDQVHDYFGIRNLSREGCDVAIWLYPLIKDVPVDHNLGPFDGLRLEFSILRNQTKYFSHFIKCISEIGKYGDLLLYKNRNLALNSSEQFKILEEDYVLTVDWWNRKKIKVGSKKALLIDL